MTNYHNHLLFTPSPSHPITPLYRWGQIILGLMLMVVLTGCGTPKPSSDIVSRAICVSRSGASPRIARQIAVPVAGISEQLDTPVPQLAISGIAVKLIETMKMGKLPTYHLQGTYNLQLDLPSEQVQQKQNPFDIYLQRQVGGKTWRLLRREGREGEQWLSYSFFYGFG